MSRVTTVIAGLMIVAVLLGLGVGCATSSPQGQQGAAPQPSPQAASQPSQQAAPQAAQPTVGTIKIGAALSLTGDLAREGEMMHKGYDLWKDTVNAKGGIKVGDKQYKIDIVYYDDKSDADTSAKLTEKLITEDKVDFLFGPYSSGITQATAVVAEKYGKITMAAMASADPVYQRGLKNLFSVLTLASHEVDPVVDLAKSVSGGTSTVAILTPDSMYPLFGAEGAKAHAEQVGLKVVYYKKYAPDVQDFYPILTDLKNSNPDVLILQSELGQVITIVKQLKELNINPKLVWTYTLNIPDIAKGLGKDADYMYGTTYFDRSLSWKDPVFGTAANYMDTFKAKYNYDPTHYEGASTAAGVILEQAVEKAGTLDSAKVRDTLSSLTGQTLFGPFKFDATGQNVAGTTIIIQRQKGELRIVWPEAVAQVKPMYPTPNWKDRP